MTTTETMKQAADTLERYAPQHGHPDDMSDAITALRTAIEAAEKQEPVKDRLDFWALFDENQRLRAELKFNTTPPAAQRKPLTKERIGQIIAQCQITLVNYCSDEKQIEFARAVEAAHGIKEKNNAA